MLQIAFLEPDRRPDADITQRCLEKIAHACIGAEPIGHDRNEPATGLQASQGRLEMADGGVTVRAEAHRSGERRVHQDDAGARRVGERGVDRRPVVAGGLRVLRAVFDLLGLERMVVAQGGLTVLFGTAPTQRLATVALAALWLLVLAQAARRTASLAPRPPERHGGPAAPLGPRIVALAILLALGLLPQALITASASWVRKLGESRELTLDIDDEWR